MSTSSSTIGPSLCLTGGAQEVSESDDSTTYNTQSLAAGTYYFIACDYTFWQQFPFMTDPCTGTYGPVTVSSQYTSTTTVQSTWTLTVSNGNDCSGASGSGTYGTGVYETVAGTCTCGSTFVMWTTSASGTCNWDTSAGINQNYNPSLLTCTSSGAAITASCGCGSCAYTTTVASYTTTIAYTSTKQSTTTHDSTTPRTTSTTTCPTC